MLKRYMFIKKRRGSAELTAYTVILPLITVMVTFIVFIIVIGTMKTRLNYASYVGCRAAIICEDLETAKEKAELAVKQNIGYMETGILAGNEDAIKVELSVDKGEAAASNQKKKSKAGKIKDNWMKGNYVTCTVTVKLNSLISGLGETEKISTTTMMIERPATDSISDILNSL